MQACEWPPQAPILKKRTDEWLAHSKHQFGVVYHFYYEGDEII
jgi:hypothetical protein